MQSTTEISASGSHTEYQLLAGVFLPLARKNTSASGYTGTPEQCCLSCNNEFAEERFGGWGIGRVMFLRASCQYSVEIFQLLP